MLSRLFLASLVCLLVSFTAVAEVPNTFTSGTPALASEVNENFSDLDSRLNTSLGGLALQIFTTSSDSSTSVVSLSCPSNTIVASANCQCDYVNGTRNYGVLFGCVVAGNGGIAGCFSEGTSYNPNLPPPQAIIQVMCASGVTNDGTPITPIFSTTDGTGGVNKAQPSGLNEKFASDELEETLQSFRDQELTRKAHLRSLTNQDSQPNLKDRR